MAHGEQNISKWQQNKGTVLWIVWKGQVHKNLSKPFSFGNTLHGAVYFYGVILPFFHCYFFLSLLYFRRVRATCGPAASWSWGSCGGSLGWQGGSEQLGGTHGAAPEPGHGHSCGSAPMDLAILSHLPSAGDDNSDNSGCLSLLEPIGFFTLITKAAKSQLYPPL